MSNNEMLEKVITTMGIAADGNGFLSVDQAKSFIDFIWDGRVLFNDAQKIVMTAPEKEWYAAAVGARIVRKATEAVDTGENASAQFTRVSLRTTKVRLDWEISTESLEDNIEGRGLDDHLAQLFGHQFGQDIEELSIHGDDTSSDKLLKTFDGWHKLALEGGRVVTHAGAGALGRQDFNKALKEMPRKYLSRKSDFKFYGPTSLVNDYLFSQSEIGIVPNEIIANTLRQSPVTSGAAGWSTNWPFGVELIEVPMFDAQFNQVNAATGTSGADDTSFIELTTPKNRIIGIQRDIQVGKEYKIKKDAIEYTMYLRFAIAWQNLDAVVTVDNIPVQD
ncbi:virion structural protein [Rhodococcus phage Trina]|uniref:Major capsid protein n=1 Tax=Rhodococcus phage Trina TaxID=2027905 RepID=A0A2D1A412_9CAUD|nr:virion structural protein [Rhodococcus phage Trina]ASZ74886.1 major capsid protein [Rhodococcus phage Trina]